MEFLTIVDFLSISPQTGNLQSRKISKTKSTNQLDLYAKGVIYFGDKLPNQLKNSDNAKKIYN